ncbi:MAG: High-affinity branched-chain amino acid transport system permease protein LivH [Candidatus Heimdallarchaeota archaeon LC_2]|nr:MAG: High-affinity branched-chain amino acid transport system permease protein LivH [Candidatus Heimdallarchaeota archaeon LC_2]
MADTELLNELAYKEEIRDVDYRQTVNKIGKILGIAIIIFTVLFTMTFISLEKEFNDNIRVNFIQHSFIIIVTASQLILISAGLTLTARVRKFSNFAHAEFVTVGIYTAIALNQMLGRESSFLQWLFVEILIVFIITGFVGILMEVLVFTPLEKRDGTALSLMVASIGVGLVIRQIIQEIFSGSNQSAPPYYPDFFSKLSNIPVLEIFFAKRSVFHLTDMITLRISRDEAWSILVMVITVYMLNYIFTKTILGISMRATADDAELAQISGINTKRVIYWTWFIAGGITGVGALFFLESATVIPFSGFFALLIIFAVVTLGGFDSFEGTLISAFIISIAMTSSVIINQILVNYEEDSTTVDKLVFWNATGDWKLATPFAVIIGVLFIRPRGIYGLVDPRSKL